MDPAVPLRREPESPFLGRGPDQYGQAGDLHQSERLTLPHRLSNGQIIEFSIIGYTGMYTVLSAPISSRGVGPPVRPAGTLETGHDSGQVDKRLGWTAVYFPQPLGFQAEWNVGRRPALNDAQTAVVDRALCGVYAMTMLRHKTCNYGDFWPFTRWSYYKGGYKAERNAPYALIDEYEVGVEWQVNKYVELTTMYTFTDRTNTRAESIANQRSYEQFVGDLLRFQLQVND